MNNKTQSLKWRNETFSFIVHVTFYSINAATFFKKKRKHITMTKASLLLIENIL